jgi:hypothetical protein
MYPFDSLQSALRNQRDWLKPRLGIVAQHWTKVVQVEITVQVSKGVKVGQGGSVKREKSHSDTRARIELLQLLASQNTQNQDERAS